MLRFSVEFGEAGAGGESAVRSCKLVAQRRALRKEEFRREVKKKLTGRETELHEIIYFKVFKSQIPVIEQGIGNSSFDAGKRQVARILLGFARISWQLRIWITGIWKYYCIRSSSFSSSCWGGINRHF